MDGCAGLEVNKHSVPASTDGGRRTSTTENAGPASTSARGSPAEQPASP